MMERTPSAAKEYAKSRLGFFGFAPAEYGCLTLLWNHESHWRPDAYNHKGMVVLKKGKKVKVHAGGIPQILGLDPKTSVTKQVDAGLSYIKIRYRTPCEAHEFWDENNWY